MQTPFAVTLCGTYRLPVHIFSAYVQISIPVTILAIAFQTIQFVRVSLKVSCKEARHGGEEGGRRPAQARHSGEDGGRREEPREWQARAFSPDGHRRRPKTTLQQPTRPRRRDSAPRCPSASLSRRRFRQCIAHVQGFKDGRCEMTAYSQSVRRQQAAVGRERLTTTTVGLHAPSTEICYSGLITHRVPVSSGD
ncbi:unnamed protein product [Rangifer tarandus platyrhynchus]|uniref:Uncharacterized protein n=1 Tax=Rangifer tarandus platyrhynchus TaxID=3082113 RepID=A0AC59Z417_RANTA